jgi:hypothetical protein
MSYPNDIYSNIDAYLKGELRGEELQEFNVALLQNQELVKEVKKARAIQKLVFQNRLLQVKDLAKLEESKLKNKKTFGNKAIFGGVLLLLALATIGVLVFNPKEEEKPSKSSDENQKTLQIIQAEGLISEENPVIEPAKEESNSLRILPEKASTNTSIPTIDTMYTKADTVIPILHSNTEVSIPEAMEIKDIKNTAEKASIDKDENNNPCEKAALKATISSTPTCKGRTNGQIDVLNIQGNYPPYNQSLLCEGKEMHSYSDLKAGSYELVVSDSKNCQQIFAVQVTEKLCPINDHFNPTYGEVWNIPMANKSGKLTIYSKAGFPVYQLNLKNNTPATWDGKNTYDQLEAGYFIFVIEYEDGEVLKGSVTITL